MARSVDLIAHSWAGCRGDFIDARPLSYTPLWMILLSLVVFDCVRSQRRINTCQGEIKLLMDGRLRWQGQDWTLLRPPVTEERDGVAFTRRVWTSSAFMAGGG